MDAMTTIVVTSAIVLGFAAIVIALCLKGDVEATGVFGSGSFSLKVKERRNTPKENRRNNIADSLG